MHHPFPTFRPARLAAALAVLLSGCAALPPERGHEMTEQLLQTRLIRTDTPATDQPPTNTEPLTLAQALQLSLSQHPKVRELYASLGLSLAELEDARRPGNPTLGWSKLDPRGGGVAQISRTIAFGLGELLMLPARKRMARAELEHRQIEVAAEVLQLATEVEHAWVHAVSASQVAAMRVLVDDAAQASAAMAQRFFDAGNISRLQLEQENAAASHSRIASVRAEVEALKARHELANLIALPADGDWRTPDVLAQPILPEKLDSEALTRIALDQRLDLVAARHEVRLLEDQLGVTRRWRWLGAVEAGYERETEADDEVSRGPELELELPLFNQGQGALGKARAQLAQARARLDGLVQQVHNQVRLHLDQLKLTHAIAERYRTALVPQRENIVAGYQLEVNFMLKGVFELLLARQEEFDAYQEYLEAVRDYWLAYAELKQALGGQLSLPEASGPSVGTPALPDEAEGTGHEHHHH